jgi:hypothetical protein
VRAVRPGTSYVLASLLSDREFPPSTAFSDAWNWLAPGVAMPNPQNYTVIVGKVGERPALIESRQRPFRVGVALDPFTFDVRMESWLPTDTIRRAGFGHVVVNRQHALTLERGLSFLAIGPGGGPIYDSGILAPLAQHVIAPKP